MKILGISAFYHDSAAALLCDGAIIAAAQEERFTRVKHDASFPSNAITFVLEYSGYRLEDIDAVVFYDKPFLKFERLLETYYAYSPRGLASFLQAMPVWIKEKLFFKKLLYDGLKKIGPIDKKKLKLLFPEHHLSHAASAFYASPYNAAAIITIDGVGEWATTTISYGDGSDIRVLKQLDFPHSPGLLYSAFTYYCGFTVNSGEYKLMGLAPYGNRKSPEYRRCADIITSKLVDLKDDGSIFLHQRYFSYATALRMVDDRQWAALFGFSRREPESPIEQIHCDMALAVQDLLDEMLLRLAKEAKRLTGSENLCMAGGVALNCVANGKLHTQKIFNNIFIQPAAGDAGGSLGAALAAHHIFYKQPRTDPPQPDLLQGSFLGPSFSDDDIQRAVRKFDAVYVLQHTISQTVATTASLIAAGKVVGWFQGRMEFGPRALGARSILADARNADMHKRLNLKIKFREGFRPFAPAVLLERVQDYFELNEASPYMLLVKNVQQNRRLAPAAGYDELSSAKKLEVLRSDLPAITHVDYSARVQTVSKETNPLFWQLLHSFEQLTGCAVVINTSFNVRGEPIVNTPEDAYRCFMDTDMDCLVMGNLVFYKPQQPAWKKRDVSTDRALD